MADNLGAERTQIEQAMELDQEQGYVLAFAYCDPSRSSVPVKRLRIWKTKASPTLHGLTVEETQSRVTEAIGTLEYLDEEVDFGFTVDDFLYHVNDPVVEAQRERAIKLLKKTKGRFRWQGLQGEGEA